MNKQKKKIFPIICTTFLLAILAIGVVWKWNKYSLVLNVTDETITLEYGVDELPEITALCKGTLINRKGTPVKTSMKGDLNLEHLGSYEVTFTAKYKDMKL